MKSEFYTIIWGLSPESRKWLPLIRMTSFGHLVAKPSSRVPSFRPSGSWGYQIMDILFPNKEVKDANHWLSFLSFHMSLGKWKNASSWMNAFFSTYGLTPKALRVISVITWHKLYLYSNFRVANKLISSSWHYIKII